MVLLSPVPELKFEVDNVAGVGGISSLITGNNVELLDGNDWSWCEPIIHEQAQGYCPCYEQ